MAQVETKPKTLGEKMLSIPKQVLYLLIIVFCAIPLFIPITLPNQPKPGARDLFAALTSLPEGSTVIIQSDWTESTKGESGSQFEALLRILMRQNIKFAICSVADPQAPQVAKNEVLKINEERRRTNQREYKKWEDWIELGYFPNGEGLGQAIRANIRDAFGAKRDSGPGQPEAPVFESPVLKNINEVGDLGMYVIVTGTQSITVAIERISDKVKMGGMVTGVMGPETGNYYDSRQLRGLSVGLKGAYDMETMMSEKYKGDEFVNFDMGTKFIVPLHFAIFLLIIAVIIGNVGVILTRKGK